MFDSKPGPHSLRQLQVVAITAAALLFAGCTPSGASTPTTTSVAPTTAAATTSPTADASNAAETPAEEEAAFQKYDAAMNWAFPQIRDEVGYLVVPDDPNAFPLPAGIPQPEGKPVVTGAADGAWAPMYETPTPDELADQLVAEMEKFAPLIGSGTYETNDGSWSRKFFLWIEDDPAWKHTADMAEHKYWQFLNDDYAIQIESTGVPFEGKAVPPPGVGIVVVDLAKAAPAIEFAEVFNGPLEIMMSSGVTEGYPDALPEGFPSDISLPEGKLGHSWATDDAWGLIIEMPDSAEVAEQFAADLGKTMTLVQKRFETVSDPMLPLRHYWEFLDERYAIQLEHWDTTGTPAPPAIGLTVVKR